MIERRIAVCLLAVGALSFGACGSDPPPPPPEPEPPPAQPTVNQDSIDAEARRRADSIRAVREREEEVRRARASLAEMVFFDYDRSEITPEAERVLRAKLEVLRAFPAIQLRIAGHADERGSTEYNLALGSRRAESVRQFFVTFGVQGSRFTTTSFGEERPLEMGTTEAAYARNRRAEFQITAGENTLR